MLLMLSALPLLHIKHKISIEKISLTINQSTPPVNISNIKRLRNYKSETGNSARHIIPNKRLFRANSNSLLPYITFPVTRKAPSSTLVLITSSTCTSLN
jgi:hypothetical protein